jgi:probable rRNA maturation factor
MINPLSVPNYPLEITLQFSSPTLQKRWAPKLPIRRVKKWVQSSLEGPAELTLLFVGNAQSKKLNQTYRHQDHATNVLTFSLDLPSSKNPKTCADLIFCIPVINQEARAQKKDPIKHLTHLIIHGVLHAQGYDHENTKQAKVMENLEIAILKKLGIENPYVIPNRVS